MLVADSEISPSPLLPLSPSRSPSPLSPLPSIGQRVGVAWLRHTCGHCGYCLAGRENLCESARFTGYHADGGYAEYAVAPADFVYPLPEAFSDVEAAPLLCAGIIGYRALRRCNLRPGGTLALYRLRLVGPRGDPDRPAPRLPGLRRHPRREPPRVGPARWAPRGSAKNPTEMPEKADSAILFAPAGELVLPALERLNKGGTLSLAGIYMTPIPSLDYERHLFYERDLHSVTCNTREDGRELLAEAAAIPIRPHTTVYPLAEANRALQDLKHDRISGTGVLTVG